MLDIQVTREYGTGIEEIDLLSELKVYPNPAVNELNISLKNIDDQINRLEILDLNGKLIIREEENYLYIDKINLKINHLPIGVYTLRLIGRNLHQVHFIKGK